mgnify:CR=1 FL=1
MSTGRGVGVFVEVGSRVGVAVRVLSAVLVAVAVRVGVLQGAGKKRMGAKEMERGRGLAVGDVLR